MFIAGWLGRTLDRRRLKSRCHTSAGVVRVKGEASFARVAIVFVTDATVDVSARCHAQQKQLHPVVQLQLSLVIWQPYARNCIRNLQKMLFMAACIADRDILFYACGYFLWPPYVIGQVIIFLPCGFFFYLSFHLFSSPNLSRHRLDVCHTSTHGVALVRI